MEKQIITKDTTIQDAISKSIGICLILKSYDMNCYSCPYKKNDTIEEGALRHNVNLVELLDKLNKCVK